MAYAVYLPVKCVKAVIAGTISDHNLGNTSSCWQVDKRIDVIPMCPMSVKYEAAASGRLA